MQFLIYPIETCEWIAENPLNLQNCIVVIIVIRKPFGCDSCSQQASSVVGFLPAPISRCHNRSYVLPVALIFLERIESALQASSTAVLPFLDIIIALLGKINGN